MEAAGIAPANPVPQVVSMLCVCGDGHHCWLEMGWRCSAPGDGLGQPVTLPTEFRRVIEAWNSLPAYAVRAILALVDSAAEHPG